MDKKQEIYEHICQNAGIDTPALCVDLYEAGPLDNTNTGAELAEWLREWYPEAWEDVCSHVDYLIEAGDIIFTDEGGLYPIGYQGASI
jgi:hypothetical protein